MVAPNYIEGELAGKDTKRRPKHVSAGSPSHLAPTSEREIAAEKLFSRICRIK